MQPLSLKDIQFFYLVILFTTMMIGSFISFRFWKTARSRDHIYSLSLLFQSLIILSLGLPPFGRLLSIIFPGEFINLELMSSLYKIISLFNNLFIILMVQSLPVNNKRFSSISNITIVIVFVSVNMLLLILDKLVIYGFPIGKSMVVILDGLISVICLNLLRRSLSAFYRSVISEYRFINGILGASIGVLTLLIITSAVLFFVSVFNPAYHSGTLMMLGLYVLYYLSVSIMVSFLLATGYLLLTGDWKQADSVLAEQDAADITPEQREDAEQGAAVISGIEIVPERIVIEYDSSKNTFGLDITCFPNERHFVWNGENCNYPFYYWLYLAVAVKLGLKVEIKNAQVMRNKMVQLLSRELKPKNFITLSGEIATINLLPENIIVNPKVFTSSLVKSKFRMHIEPFLSLVNYDQEKYRKDRMYNEYIFLETYEKIQEQFAGDENL